MKIGGMYSFNNGQHFFDTKFQTEFEEIQNVIARVNASQYRTKISKEKTMAGQALYSPKELNQAFKTEFQSIGWEKYRKDCQYSNLYYIDEYKPPILSSQASQKKPFREMDFVKNKVGVEVQFGKYAFMVYNVCAKMTIFHNLGVIDVGIEIVPLKEFADQMSTGVSYFEQFVWDLNNRGVGNIDIPVLVLGLYNDQE